MTARWRGPILVAVVIFGAVVASMLLSDALHPDAAHALTYTQARHMSAARVRAVIRHEAKRAHLGKADTAALLTIARMESTYRPWSHNRACWGLFQLKMTRSKARRCRWWSPDWSTRRAIRYVRHRYGTARRALAFHRRHGYY